MSQNAIIIDLPRAENALREPEIWNRQWESLCAQGVLTPSLIFENECRDDHMKSLRSVADVYSHLLNSALLLRMDIAKKYAPVTTDFDEEWCRASKEVRRRHALLAISKTCSVARNLNNSRAQTSDILTLSNLSDNGHTVVRLIREMLPDDLSSEICDEVYYFPNTARDNFKASVLPRPQCTEKDKFTLERILLLRASLVCE